MIPTNIPLSPLVCVAFGLLLMTQKARSLTEEEAQRQYCCYLSEEELEGMRGTHKSCPTQGWNAVKTGGDKCDACPEGTCRVKSTEQGSREGRHALERPAI